MRRAIADTERAQKDSDSLESPKKKPRSRPRTKTKTKTKTKASGKLSPLQLQQRAERAVLAQHKANNDAEAALEWYARLKSSSVALDQSMYALLLSILCSSDFPAAKDATLQVYEEMKKRGMCGEATESLLVRALCRRGEAARAEKLVKDMENSGVEVKIRSIAPLLQCYCGNAAKEPNSLDTIFLIKRTYEKLKKAVVAKDEDFEVEMFGMVLDAAVKCSKSDQVEVKIEAENLAAACLADVANFVRLGDKELTAKVKDWAEALDSNWTIRCDCEVDQNGICKGCGLQLHSRELSREQELTLATATEKLVKNAGSQAVEPWQEFKLWLQKRGKSESYDCVVDVANVAYFQSNLAHTRLRFEFSAVKRVVDVLKESGRRCIMVMHESHLGKRDCRTKEDKAIVKEWREEDSLYIVPRGLLDDWFWLYATLAQGERTLIVSNDWMRDHHFMMLRQREFQRWREQHQVRFQLIPDSASDSQESLRVQLHFPTPFTRRVQVELDEDPTLVVHGKSRVKRGPYAPTSPIKSIHIPISQREVRRTQKGKPLPYVADLPRCNELAWFCCTKAS